MSRDNEILASAGCMLVMNFVSTIMDLPLKIYNTFVLEEKHGFNKQVMKFSQKKIIQRIFTLKRDHLFQTPAFFIKDQIKKFIVVQLIALPFLCGVIWIVKNSGDNFFIYVWLFAIVITLSLSVLYPEVIAPLFDKYTPLPDGELKEKIEALAASVDFPLYKLYIVEGSKRSSHSNAYMYGFYKHKRIVLFDTLVKGYFKDETGEDKDKGCEIDEVVGVLAHELGHWKYYHTVQGLILAQVRLSLISVCFHRKLQVLFLVQAIMFNVLFYR